jgi:hypothetical protein
MVEQAIGNGAGGVLGLAAARDENPSRLQAYWKDVVAMHNAHKPTRNR